MQTAHNRISGELAAVVGVLCPEVIANSKRIGNST